MKTFTLNGDLAVAVNAYSQFYDDFQWTYDEGRTVFDFGLDVSLFDGLEERFGAHTFVSPSTLTWSDGIETITLTTDETLSYNAALRATQLMQLSSKSDTLNISYFVPSVSDGTKIADISWSQSGLVLKSGDQRVEIDIPSDVTFADLGDITSIISTFSGFSEAFEDAQNHAIETAIELGLGQIQYQHQDQTQYAFYAKDGIIIVTSRGYNIELRGDFTRDDAVYIICDLLNLDDTSGLSVFLENELIESLKIQEVTGNTVAIATTDPSDPDEIGISEIAVTGTLNDDEREIDTQFLDSLMADTFVATLAEGNDKLIMNVTGQWDQINYDYIFVNNQSVLAPSADQDIDMIPAKVDGGEGFDTLYVEHARFADGTYKNLDIRGPIKIDFDTGFITGDGYHSDQTTFEVFKVQFESIECLQTDWMGDLAVTGSKGDDWFSPMFVSELGKNTLSFDGDAGVDTLDLSHLINANANEYSPSEWTSGLSASDWVDLNWRWSIDGNWHVISMGSDALIRLKSVERIRFQGDEEYLLDAYLELLPHTDARVGTLSEDSLVTADGHDLIYALDGNDTVQSHAGDDTIYAALGDDHIDGAAGADIIHAGGGNDTIEAGADNDMVHGAAGHDHIDGATGDDTLFAGSGSDTIIGGEGNDQIWGESGNDQLQGDAGTDQIYGGDGNDTLIGGEGADILNGGTGDDQLIDHDGGGTINGEAGDDTIHLYDTLSTDITVNGGDDEDTLILHHLDYGTRYNDQSQYWDITKTTDGYVINLGLDYDKISHSITLLQTEFIQFSGKITDKIENVFDWMNTERGDVFRLDNLDQTANQTVNMGDGDNYAEITQGNFTLIGGTGDDTVIVGSAQSTTTRPKANLTLGDGANSVSVYSGIAEIQTGRGEDTISVLSDLGVVTARTGSGQDHITSHDGNDVIHSGAGNDTISTGSGNDRVMNISGQDYLQTGSGTNHVTSLGNDTTIDERGDDGTHGKTETLDDIFITSIGNDTMHGGAGNDVILTDLSRSTYYGSDEIAGMKGDDILCGGQGADTFIFRAGDGNDTVGGFKTDNLDTARILNDIEITGTDFTSGIDRVHLHFGTEYVGMSLSDTIRLNEEWAWVETDTGARLETSDGSIHFWGVKPSDLTDSDFEFMGEWL